MKSNNKHLSSLDVVIYKEDNIYYAICIPLDIIGYGKSVEEAKQSFAVMIEEISPHPIPRYEFKGGIQEIGCIDDELLKYLGR